MSRLKKIKQQLKSWNRDVFGDLRLLEAAFFNRLKELDLLESSGSWSEELRSEREKLKKELVSLQVKKEISMSQKMKIQWVKDVDVNSRLFHRLLDARKSKNFISKLELDNGEVLLREEDIVKEILNFFENLYSEEIPQFGGFDGVEWKGISTFYPIG